MTLQSLIKLFDRDLGKLKNEVSLYPSEEAPWMVMEGITNSGGNLCTHICGNLRHFVGALLGKDGYIRNRDLEFSIKSVTRAELCQEIRATAKALASALSGLDEQELTQKFPSQNPIPDATINEVLISLYGHLNCHLGQINYHRRLLSRPSV